MTPTFDRFIALDWTGGRGTRHPGVAIAQLEADGALSLTRPPAGGWSRTAAVDHVLALDQLPGATLVGFDFSFSLPFVDMGTYFPGEAGPHDALSLWEALEAMCASEPDYYAGPMVSRYADHFLKPGQRGARFVPRLRLTEVQCRAQGLGRAASPFHLIGPNQVGLASLSGMRALKTLRGAGVAIWPFDPPKPQGVTVVEIYAALYQKRVGLAQRKLRSAAELRRALALYGVAARLPRRIDDHQADALVSAAGMCALANDAAAAYWHPSALSDTVRRTEGWTWGVP